MPTVAYAANRSSSCKASAASGLRVQVRADTRQCAAHDPTAEVYHERLSQLLKSATLRIPRIRKLQGDGPAAEKGLGEVEEGEAAG